MNRLKVLRITRGLTQQQVATLLNSHQPEISRIESGQVNPSTKQLAMLSRILDDSTDKLLDEISIEEVRS